MGNPMSIDGKFMFACCDMYKPKTNVSLFSLSFSIDISATFSSNSLRRRFRRK